MRFFVLFFCFSTASGGSLGDLRLSVDSLSARITELESQARPVKQKVKTQYYKFIKKLYFNIKDKLVVLINEPNFIIKFINSSTLTISVLLILITLTLIFSFIFKVEIDKKEKVIYRTFVNKVIERTPEISILLLPLIKKQILGLLNNFSNLDLFFFQDEINLFSELSGVFLVYEIVFYSIQRILFKESKSIRKYLLIISLIRVCKIFIRFLINLNAQIDIGDSDYELGQLEAISVFIVIITLLIRIRKISYSFPKFNRILPYMTAIAGFCTLLAYLTTNQGIRFMYKLFMSLMTWPFLNHLASLFRGWTRRFLSDLPRAGNSALKGPIQVWLILTNLIHFLSVPCSLFISMYIFDLNLLIESKLILQNIFFQRTCLVLLLYLNVRIFSLINLYVADLYVSVNSENRPFDLQRVRTSAQIIRYCGITIIYIIAIFSLLSILGYNVTPLFQTIGLFSAALTFSLQQLIRDLINGICILYENSIKIGDWIDYEGKTAVVEDMSLRFIRARLDDGLLVTVPFHKLDIIKNKSRYHSYLVYNLSIARSVPVEDTESAVNQAFILVSERPEFKYKIISKDIELRDIADVTGFSYVFQFRIAVQPQSQNKIKRAFNRELLKIFDEREIKVAMPMVANATNVPSFATGDPYPDFQ